jgi:hypothetical protein
MRSLQSLSYSWITQNYIEPEGSSSYSQNNSTGSYSEPDEIK